MGKAGYLISRIREMDVGNMVQQAKEVHQRCKKPTLWILADMTLCGFRYGAGYMDYVVFEWYRLNASQRRTQVTRGINNGFVHQLNKRESWYKFEDKPTFNRLFAPFVNRDWVDLREEGAKERFFQLVQQHPDVIAKPVDGLCGKGVEKLSLEGFASPEEMYRHVMENRQLMVEEYVVQHPKMMELYPYAVNTLRLVTVHAAGQVTIVFCGVRIGVGGSVVDNINSGGLASVIDLETGIITKPAADKNGRVYQTHPDTGAPIVGFAVPDFDQVRDMVKKAALVVEEIGYVAWDVAVTEKGPVFIEGNHFPGHDIYQMPVHIDGGIGLLPVFRKALGQEGAE